MADYDNTNTGVVYFNAPEDKKNDKQPDYDIQINFMGKDIRIAGWKRQTKQGKKMISLRLEDVTEGSSNGGGGKSSSKSSNDSG